MATAKSSSQAVCNLPFAMSDAFSGDDIALLVGTCLPDAVFVMDEETHAIVGGNLGFLSLIGVGLEIIETQDSTIDALVAPADRAVFDAWCRSAAQGEGGNCVVNICPRDGKQVEVNVELRQLRWKRRSYMIGFLRDVSALERKVAQLKRSMEEQKERAFEAIKSSLRQYQFNEKIKRTPHMAKSLLNLDSEDKLFSEAAKILTSEDGLGYQDATFLVVDQSLLRVAFSTREDAVGACYPLNDEHRFSAFIRNGLRQDNPDGDSWLVPLQSRGRFLGVFEVSAHSKEKLFFDESSRVQQWQKDVLQDIGGIVALLIDNLRLNREVKRQSIIDPLTQAYNRHYFVGRLAAEVRRSRRYSRPVSLIFLDVDRFKSINDRYGHLQGDDVLSELGKVFRACLREVDVTCRYGGDEFVILLPETDEAMAMQTAQKILHGVEDHEFKSLDNPKVTISVTVSVGVSSLGPEQNEDQFLQRADEALYRAKRAGRNRVAVGPVTEAREATGANEAPSCSPALDPLDLGEVDPGEAPLDEARPGAGGCERVFPKRGDVTPSESTSTSEVENAHRS